MHYIRCYQEYQDIFEWITKSGCFTASSMHSYDTLWQIYSLNSIFCFLCAVSTDASNIGCFISGYDAAEENRESTVFSVCLITQNFMYTLPRYADYFFKRFFLSFHTEEDVVYPPWKHHQTDRCRQHGDRHRHISASMPRHQSYRFCSVYCSQQLQNSPFPLYRSQSTQRYWHPDTDCKSEIDFRYI